MRRFTTPIVTVFLMLVLTACGGSPHKTGYHTKYGLSAHSPTFGLPPKGLTLPRLSSSPSKLMLDTVSLSSFRGLRIEVAAGYTSGSWPTFGQMVGRYPHVVAVMVYQTHFGVRGHRSCLDSEPGDAPASAAGPWAVHEIHIHIIPCVYTSISAMPGVKSSLARYLGSNWRSKVFLWDANWTFVYHLDAGYDATQWTDHYLNRNIDGNAVTYRFAGISTTPTRTICFGPHAQLHNRTCKVVRPQVDKWSKAAASSNRAYVRKGCPVLAQRVAWFSNAIHSHPRSPKTPSRRRALVTSRRQYYRQSCNVFRQRASWFGAKAAAEVKKYS